MGKSRCWEVWWAAVKFEENDTKKVISLKTNKEETPMKIMTVRAPDELQRTLTEIAQKKKKTRNALILQILWEWLERKERE